MRTRRLRTLVYVGAALGLIAATYAGAEFYDASLTSSCTVNLVISCSKIANSGRTTTFGLQDWVWGVGGFVLLLLLGVLAERRRKDSRVAYTLAAVSTAGVALSLYFLFVEVVQIQGICPVCVSAYVCGWVVCVGALGLARKAYRRDHPPASASATDPA
jgi:uncharacterized membrane protein